MATQSIQEILKSTFGFDTFRLEQENVINSVLEGKDTLAIMPTGGGKSLCYQIPALQADGVCIVISPLISLMQDQVMNLHEYDIEACFLNSSQSFQERRDAEAKILSGKIKLVYVSPEGILSPQTYQTLQQLNVSLLAIDEAHCVSQWGHEFRKDYKRLGELRELFPGTPLLALTATADAKTRSDIADQLEMNSPNIFVSSFDRPNIKYMILERKNEVMQLSDYINEYHPEDTGIVYCLSRAKVEKVANELSKKGYHAVPYHAGLSQEVRLRNQQLFNKEEKIIVVATIAFGMGIDRPDVRFVAHLDLPKSIEGYYQETGRAGRDGKPASAWMIYGLQDVVKLSMMLEKTEAGEAYKKVARHKLDSMLSLCETVYCRRQYLLGYFGEKSAEHCGACDCCLEPGESWDATTDAQKILSTIYRTGQVFGAGHIIDVIRGSQSAKVLERGHDKLTVHGIGKEHDQTFWQSILRQLMHMGYISIKNWEYRGLCLSEQSREILSGEKNLLLKTFKTKVKKKAASPKNKKSADHDRDDLFEELRSLRKELAEENSVPPYVVFPDKTLHEMCVFLPRNDSEFLMINGVGNSKREKYGDTFMKVINHYLTHSSPSV